MIEPYAQSNQQYRRDKELPCERGASTLTATIGTEGKNVQVLREALTEKTKGQYPI